MTEKNEWRAAVEELRAEERQRLGDPPTPEEILAYARGTLSEADAARVRARIVLDPELADVMIRPVPENVDAMLSESEMASDWSRIQRRIAEEIPAPPPRESKKSLPFRLGQVAAVLSITVLAGLLIESRSTIERLSRERDAPRVHAIRHELSPISPARGPNEPEPYPLPRQQEDYLLVLLLFEKPRAEAYRLNIVDERAQPPRTIWRTRIVLRRANALELSVRRAFFEPGVTYRLDLYRDDVRTGTPEASYLVRVPR